MNALQLAVATVWLVNGLYAKALNRVPRHRAIVARFFGENAVWLTPLIGFGEIGMGAWVLSGRARPACFAVQAALVVTMNALEYWKARDLLLFPRLMPFANAGLLGAAFWLSRGGS